ncbi:unnamed protein product [Cochlearia groenlandica]
MNNNIIFNEDYMLYPYNDHYSSQPLLPFSPSSSSSSSINNILNHSTPNIHLNHHHQFLQAPSPFYPFEFSPEFAFLFPQSNGHDDYQTITTNDPIEESQQVMPLETNIEDISQSISTFQEPIMNKIKKPIRTDRHSKIKTAKGTRDRRMRLSVDVAKELFGLQDMLGFDKASKTVEWLLTQAKPEIIKIAKKITNQLNHGGFSSEDESQTKTRENKVDGRTIRGKRKMSQRRTHILKKLCKEERAKARERAKDRTKEKMILRRSSQHQFTDIHQILGKQRDLVYNYHI